MTNTLCVCLILVITSFAPSIAYPKQCNKGPAYWCSSLSNANECDAVGHCQQTVWGVQNSAAPTKCDECKTFIDSVRADKLDDSLILRTVYHFCKHFDYKRKCKLLVTKDAKATINVIKSDLSSQKVCQIADLCSGKAEPAKEPAPKPALLGSKKCSWGPSFWCANFSNSRGCHATSHCIQSVWSKMRVNEDKDTVCQICTDMVKQARDQLESNQTQNDLKMVFEGSCKLIPIKLVAEECIKMVDEFVPELVETLASQMNPQVVCSVAGLCNNARIDALLQDYNNKLKGNKAGSEQCTGCLKVMNVAKRKFDEATYEEILVGLLKGCRQLGTYTDACSAAVFSRFEDLHSSLRQQLKSHNAQQVCRATGMCSALYHQHPEDDAYVPINTQNLGDDVPCEFCEQLVIHLRDILVANTTAEEFYAVLKGLCKATGSYENECLSEVKQWYPLIYNYLVSDLKPKQLCALAGICNDAVKDDTPIAPLLPAAIIASAAALKVKRVDVPERRLNVRVIGPDTITPAAPLPIERMFVPMPQSKPACEFCQYFLHYVQVEISDTNNEDKIKTVVEHACDKLPSSFDDECKQFVEAYGPSVIALLVQEIDPSSVCPALGLCPSDNVQIRKVEINAEKSTCPLCLFAIEQLETLVKNNKTEENIKAALHTLCNHLSSKMRTDCTDFVDAYSSKIVEMIIADLNAEEICVHLKLCKDESADVIGLQSSHIDKFFDSPHLQQDRNRMRKPILPPHMREEQSQLDHMIETNEIPDNTVNGRVKPSEKMEGSKGVCIICQYIMKELDDEIKDKNNDDEIKTLVHNVCKRLPKSVQKECDDFVDKYADLIIALLGDELDPSEVCEKLKLCDPTQEGNLHTSEMVNVNGRVKTSEKVEGSNGVCVICQYIMKEIDDEIKDKHNDDEIKTLVHNVCKRLPKSVQKECDDFVDTYADLIITVLGDGLEPYAVCEKLKLCDPTQKGNLQNTEMVQESVLDCAVCEVVIKALEVVLRNERIDHSVVHLAEKACNMIPPKYYERCYNFMETYGESVIHLITTAGAKGVCEKIGKCAATDLHYVRLYQGRA